MPKYDKTGPAGLGSKTGRGLGSCDDYCAGCGRRMGLSGQGLRNMRNQPNGLKEQKHLLEIELEAVKLDLENINKELEINQ